MSGFARRDSEQFLVAKERQELREVPQDGLEELAGILSGCGINRDAALEAAREIHRRMPCEPSSSSNRALMRTS